jgi:Fe2+ or Zn2+ uptake regulation protein
MSLLDRLRGRGRRVTAQRRVIAEVLDGKHVHLTADEILRRARRRMPEISLATVYNTVNALVALGEVQPVDVGGRVRYDPNVGAAHHHLVCLTCGTVRDVYPRGRLSLPKGERGGYRLVGQDVVFKGYCPRCAGAQARGRPGHTWRP